MLIQQILILGARLSDLLCDWPGKGYWLGLFSTAGYDVLGVVWLQIENISLLKTELQS